MHYNKYNHSCQKGTLMKKDLSTGFDTRQYMMPGDYEIFYYNDARINRISAHSHSHYEFYFFMEGDMDYEVNGITYSLQYGDYMLIPPKILHQPHFHSDDIPYRRFVFWMNPSYFDKLCQIGQDFAYGYDYALKNQHYHFRPDFITAQEIQGRLLDLIEECNGNRPFKEMQTQLMSASFLLYINRLSYDLLHQVPPSYENVLYLNLCDYINNHLDEDLSLEQLASFFYVSKYHISHIFKDNMGISLHQYITKKRLQASKNGILSGIPFGQVYQQYGFNDYTSFYRAFKKEFGSSPKDFKEQHKMPEDYVM